MKARLPCTSIVDRVYPLIHKTVNYSIHLFRMDVLRFLHLHVHTHIRTNTQTHHIRIWIDTRCTIEWIFLKFGIKNTNACADWNTFTITWTITFTVCKRCQCFNWTFWSVCVFVSVYVYFGQMCVCVSRKPFFGPCYV